MGESTLQDGRVPPPGRIEELGIALVRSFWPRWQGESAIRSALAELEGALRLIRRRTSSAVPGYDALFGAGGDLEELQAAVEAALEDVFVPWAGYRPDEPALRVRELGMELWRSYKLLSAGVESPEAPAERSPSAGPPVEVTDRPGPTSKNGRPTRIVVVDGREHSLPSAQAGALSRALAGLRPEDHAEETARSKARTWLEDLRSPDS